MQDRPSVLSKNRRSDSDPGERGSKAAKALLLRSPSPQRGLPRVDVPRWGAFLIPRPLAVVGEFFVGLILVFGRRR